MIWVALIVGAVVVVAIALASVGRVTADLHGGLAPALLELDDAIDVVAEALPGEVTAVLSHDDVRQIIVWVLDWFGELGMASEFGEEVGGDWVEGEHAVADEIGAVENAVSRGLSERPDLDSVHVTVVVDALLTYLRDIGGVGDEVR
ncbi:MAG: hypothetical protein ACR2P0_16010 [Acidimicrobiales bacterium]